MNLGLPHTPRLMILTDSYPPYGQGGATRIPYYHAKGLKERGWEIAVVTSYPDAQRKNPQITVEEGITVYHLFQLYPLSQAAVPSLFDKALGMATTLRNPLMTQAVCRAIDHFSPNILHAHHIPRISYDVFAKVTPHIPRALTFHTYHYECPKGGLFRKRKRAICEKKPSPCRYFENIMQQALSPVDRIIAISHFIERRLLLAGYDPGKIRYIPNGVPEIEGRSFNPPSKSRELLYVGRLTHAKGLLALISAFARIPDSSTRLTIVGDGPIRHEIENVAHSDKRISFLGWLDPDEVAAHYQRSRIVIVPSVWHEVMNTVICEAQSWGRPVIATHVGGNSDMIKNGITGILVPSGNVLELEHSIRELLSDDHKTDQIGQLGYDAVKQFSMSRHINELTDLYENLLNSC